MTVLQDYSPRVDPAYKVLLKKGEFVDSDRLDDAGQPRVVPFKIYHPAPSGDADIVSPMPVILWSHGFGGNRDGAGFISRHLAGQGYVLVHITHHGTDSSLWEGKPGHPWDILQKVKISRDDTLNRFYDVPFVIDQLPQWAQDNADVGSLMDLSCIGMSGHSFGAMTTQVMAGQKFPAADGSLIQIKEPRIKAGIAYSPVPIRHLLSDDITDSEVYGPIDMPLLHMTGTLDSSPLEAHGYEYRLPVFECTEHDEKYLLIKEGGDHMVYNGTRGKLGNSDLRELHEEQIKAAALAFWDAQLKSDKAAKAWLRDNLQHG